MSEQTSDVRHTDAIKLIKSSDFIVIATCTPDAAPWNSPVAAVADTDLNFYWYSHKETQHSTNIRANGQVFAVVFDSEGTGVYMEGEASELETVPDALHAQSVYTSKFPAERVGDFLPPSDRRFYRLSPHKIWVNDAEKVGKEFVRDYRIELDIKKLREAMS